jgi:hypothetical protein
MPAGLPPRLEYPNGERVPFVQDAQGMNLPFTRWRCMGCGTVTEYAVGQSFSHCGSCAFAGNWGFVDARQSP